MKREELAKTLAQQTGLSAMDAQVEVDKLVHSILRKLRQGHAVKVPGVGKLLGTGRNPKRR